MTLQYGKPVRFAQWGCWSSSDEGVEGVVRGGRWLGGRRERKADVEMARRKGERQGQRAWQGWRQRKRKDNFRICLEMLC